jgi:hypothetical protein
MKSRITSDTFRKCHEMSLNKFCRHQIVAASECRLRSGELPQVENPPVCENGGRSPSIPA